MVQVFWNGGSTHTSDQNAMMKLGAGFPVSSTEEPWSTCTTQVGSQLTGPPVTVPLPLITTVSVTFGLPKVAEIVRFAVACTVHCAAVGVGQPPVHLTNR